MSELPSCSLKNWLFNFEIIIKTIIISSNFCIDTINIHYLIKNILSIIRKATKMKSTKVQTLGRIWQMVYILEYLD